MLSGRRFQFWDYHVSHGKLLLRSPADGVFSCNCDIVFFGVSHLILARHLGELSIKEEIEKEAISQAECLFRIQIGPPYRLYSLGSALGTFWVVGVGLHMSENKLDLFDSGFQ